MADHCTEYAFGVVVVRSKVSGDNVEIGYDSVVVRRCPGRRKEGVRSEMMKGVHADRDEE